MTLSAVRTLACGALLLASTGFAATAVTPLDLQQRVGIEPHLGAAVPLDASFRDERGTSRRLGEWMAGRPAVLTLVYFDCPNLCDVTLRALARSVAQARIDRAPGYSVIAISIDPRETPTLAARQAVAVVAAAGNARDRACANCAPSWHFLTGAEPDIHGVAQALGYRYFWDAAAAQYAHPAGSVVVTGAGRIVQYLDGVEFPAPELQRALALAADNRTGSVADRFWLLCYHYQALAGRYAGAVTTALRLLGLATMAALAFLLLRLIRARA